MRIKLKKIRKEGIAQRPKYDECDPEQNIILNWEWEQAHWNQDPNLTSYQNLHKKATEVIKNNLPKRIAKHNKRGITESMDKLISDKKEHIKNKNKSVKML